MHSQKQSAPVRMRVSDDPRLPGGERSSSHSHIIVPYWSASITLSCVTSCVTSTARKLFIDILRLTYYLGRLTKLTNGRKDFFNLKLSNIDTNAKNHISYFKVNAFKMHNCNYISNNVYGQQYLLISHNPDQSNDLFSF